MSQTKIVMRLILDTEYTPAKARALENVLRKYFYVNNIPTEYIQVRAGSIEAVVEFAAQHFEWLISGTTGIFSYIFRSFLSRSGIKIFDTLWGKIRKRPSTPQVSTSRRNVELGNLVDAVHAQLERLDRSLSKSSLKPTSICKLAFDIRTDHFRATVSAVRDGTTHETVGTLTTLRSSQGPRPEQQTTIRTLANESITIPPELTSGADILAVLRGSATSNFFFPEQEEIKGCAEIDNLSAALYRLNNFDGARPIRLEKAEPQLEELLTAAKRAGWAVFGVRTHQVAANPQGLLEVANLAIVSSRAKSVQLLNDGEWLVEK